jgi:hypothetical protein
VPLEPVPEPLRPLVAAGLAKDPGARPADGIALVAAALLLAALWPTGGPAAVQGSTVHQVRLLRRLTHAPRATIKPAVTVGVVTAGIAIATPVILAKPTSHPAPAPASASAAAAPAPAAAAAPAQWTGTQLAAALLPISDFPAGYSVSESINSGNSLSSLQSGITPTKAGCSSGMMPQIVAQNGYFYPEFSSAYAADSYSKLNQANGTGYLFLSQAIFQFASPAKARAFFSAVRTCVIDDKTWSDGVDTAPVNGDQAVTADLRSTDPTGSSYDTEPLFVLHGADVFALSAASYPSAGPSTIPGAADLIAKLIARVGAIGQHPTDSPAQAVTPAPT